MTEKNMTERENDVTYSSETPDMESGKRTYLYSYYVTKVLFILNGAACSMYTYCLLLMLIPNEVIKTVGSVLAWMHVALEIIFAMISLPVGILPLRSVMVDVRRRALFFDAMNLFLLAVTIASCFLIL